MSAIYGTNWKVTDIRGGGNSVVITGEGGHGGGLVIRVMPTVGPDQHAVAALVAAAPDLLVAVKAQAALIADMSRFVAHMVLKDYALFNEAPLKAQAAITKATRTKR